MLRMKIIKYTGVAPVSDWLEQAGESYFSKFSEKCDITTLLNKKVLLLSPD